MCRSLKVIISFVSVPMRMMHVARHSSIYSSLDENMGGKGRGEEGKGKGKEEEERREGKDS